MSEYQLVEERTISGNGLIRIPFDSLARDFILYIQVVRRPSSEYKNFDWVPPKSVYGRLTQLFQGSVTNHSLIEFENSAYRFTQDISAQNLKAINCAYIGNLQSFFNLANCIFECQPFNITNNVAPMTPLPAFYEEIAIRCYADTALLLQLYKLEYVECGNETSTPPPELPPPPDNDLVEPGVPIGDLSAPYDEDDDITEPFPGDETEPGPDEPLEFPFGEECQKYVATSAITTTTNGREVRSEPVYGVITEFFYNPSGGPDGNTRDAIIITCRGLAEFNGVEQPCIDEVTYVWQDASPSEFVSAEIISLTPIT